MVRLIAIQVLYSYLQAHLDLQTVYNLIYLGVFRFLSMGFAMVFITNPNEWRRAAREFTESYAYLVRVQDGVLCYVDCRSTRLALLESIHSHGQKILDRTHSHFL